MIKRFISVFWMGSKRILKLFLFILAGCFSTHSRVKMPRSVPVNVCIKVRDLRLIFFPRQFNLILQQMIMTTFLAMYSFWIQLLTLDWQQKKRHFSIQLSKVRFCGSKTKICRCLKIEQRDWTHYVLGQSDVVDGWVYSRIADYLFLNI